MKIIIGADGGGFSLKEAVKKALQERNYVCYDATPEPVTFYAAAGLVAGGVAAKEYDRGIVICGTGMGVSIIANKHRGVYAALCESYYQARRSRAVNNTNVLCMGGMLTGYGLGIDMALVWLETEHLQGLTQEEAAIVETEYQSLKDAENSIMRERRRQE